MADVTNVQDRNRGRNRRGWLIGGVIIILSLLYIAYAGSGAPTADDGAGLPIAEPAPISPATAPPAATE